MKFKVGDLVRVKPKKDIPPNYHFAAGRIVEIIADTKWPYLVSLTAKLRQFAEDELEKI